MTESASRTRTTILVAPAASGKTHRLIRALVSDRSEIRPRWAVLPDRTQVASFRRRVAQAGGALGVSVGTFGDLFQEILARAGRPVAVTPMPARQRLLRLALRRLEAERRLPYYQPIVRTPGFLEVVGEAIAELKRARVEPEAVIELARALEAPALADDSDAGASPTTEAVGGAAVPATGAISEAAALAELADIYAEYERRLAAIAWTDREGLNQLAIQALGEQPGLLADMPLIAVDGFDSFEAAQLAALAALSAQVGQLIVTLPGTEAMERAAFRRFAKGLHALREALPDAVIEQLERSAGLIGGAGGQGRQAAPNTQPAFESPERLAPRPQPLVQLEAALFEPDPAPFDPQQAIELIEARSPAEEAREALRWIKARLLRDGVNLEDCAVIAPDAARYGPPLRRAAAEFGVQLRFSHGRSLIQAPAVAALLDLLELSRSDWPRRLTLQTVRSPFFDLGALGFLPGDALALDAASQVGQVIQGFEQWQHTLERLIEAEPESEPESAADDLPSYAAPHGEAAARLWRSLRELARRLSPAGPAATVEWVEWLENLLDELRFPELAAIAPDGQPLDPDGEHPPFERLRETLRALVLGEVVTGQERLTFGEFLEELRGALDSAAYRDRLAAAPAVNVLGVSESRGGRYRAVAIVGLAEGVWPEIEREDPFLEEATRAALGLEPRLGREQTGLFYQAVTRADGRLLLTRPYLAEDGEVWEASPFWNAAARLLTQPPRRVRPEEPRPLPEAGSPEELLFWGVRRAGMPAPLLEPHRARWSELQHGRDVLAARNAPRPEGQFEGGLQAAAEALAARFGAGHTWSPSRLETYGSCPHMFFAAHLLGLEPREPPEPGLDAAQLGSILHELLEAAYGTADDPTDPESVLEALGRALDPILDAAPQRHGFRPTPLWEIERGQYAESLRDTVLALAEQGSDWTPIGLELPFGIDDSPALELELGGGRRVRVRGLIDRLDQRPDGGLRVIDYKTGRSRLGAVELNDGRRIQLPLYALAAQQALELGEVVDGFYWAILAAERGSLRLSNYRLPEDRGEAGPKYGPAAAYAVARGHVRRIVDGVNAGQFQPIPPPGGCPSYCPAAAWCWRYQPAGWG